MIMKLSIWFLYDRDLRHERVKSGAQILSSNKLFQLQLFARLKIGTTAKNISYLTLTCNPSEACITTPSV